MKCTAISLVLTFIFAALLARAQENQDGKTELRRRRVFKPFAIDSSRIEQKEGPSDFLVAELGEEDEKMWFDLIRFSESISTSLPTP